MWVVQVKVAHMGSELAVTLASDIDNEIYVPQNSLTGTPARRPAPTVVVLYDVKKKWGSVSLHTEYLAPAPPISFALAFDERDEVLSVGGASFYSFVGSVGTGQKGKIVYRIEKSNSNRH